MTIKSAWDAFSSVLFSVVTGFTDEEIDMMSQKAFDFHHKVYDIFMILVVFAAGTWAAAQIYEQMSMAALGIIPFNFIQISPLAAFSVMVIYLGYAGTLAEKIE